MILIVGLGNPEKKYEKTRHNIGFRIAEEFIKENNFPGFQLSKKFNALTSEGFLNREKTIFALPQTFMNNSGKTVKALVNFYKIKLENLWVVHDDVDLPLGKIRVSENRGAGGHKGVESIIRELGSKDFWRIRIGIQPRAGKPKNVEKFVLQKFKKEEEGIIRTCLRQNLDSLLYKHMILN